MMEKNSTINIAYHFLAEGMIVFLLTVPFTYGEYTQIPYWVYLGMIFAMCVVFSVYSINEKMYGWYMATMPVFTLFFLMAKYPLYLSIGFPLVLTYRYIQLRKDITPNKETSYLNVIVTVSIALLIWVKDLEIMV